MNHAKLFAPYIRFINYILKHGYVRVDLNKAGLIIDISNTLSLCVPHCPSLSLCVQRNSVCRLHAFTEAHEDAWRSGMILTVAPHVSAILPDQIPFSHGPLSTSVYQVDSNALNSMKGRFGLRLRLSGSANNAHLRSSRTTAYT